MALLLLGHVIKRGWAVAANHSSSLNTAQKNYGLTKLLSTAYRDWPDITQVSPENFTCYGDSTVLLYSTNRTMTHEKVITHVIALLTRNSKKCYSRHMKVFSRFTQVKCFSVLHYFGKNTRCVCYTLFDGKTHIESNGEIDHDVVSEVWVYFGIGGFSSD